MTTSCGRGVPREQSTTDRRDLGAEAEGEAKMARARARAKMARAQRSSISGDIAAGRQGAGGSCSRPLRPQQPRPREVWPLRSSQKARMAPLPESESERASGEQGGSFE